MKVLHCALEIVIMNRIVFFIIISMVFSTPFHDFHIGNETNNLGRSNGSFPDSNGIIDIEEGSSYIWISTGAGLGKLDFSNFIFEGIESPNLPIGGNPALFTLNYTTRLNRELIAISGVTQEYVESLETYQPKGRGIAYSFDNGISWDYMPQPICEDCGEYETISWGGQELQSLAVTTEINNVSYDIGIGPYDGAYPGEG